jgi:hypothetical protein
MCMFCCCCCCCSGRLAPLQAWFLKWEGAVVGGLIAGGLVTLGVKLYVTERLDDIER